LAEKKKRLEETVTFEPSAVDSWIELADHKRRYDNAGAIDEALRCFEEAIWHEDDPDAVKILLNRFLGFIESIPKQGPARQSIPHAIRDEIGIRSEILRFLSNAPSDGKTGAAWIKDTSNRLRASSLPKKARWILWREICRLTCDKIGAETARENIRTELNRSGLLERDSFSFISRHMLARFGSKATERRTDLEMLLRHVQTAMETIEEPDYRSIVRSILAKCYLEFGDPDRCRAELKTAIAEAEKAVKDYGSARPKKSSHSIDMAYKARAVVLSN
jgi:tetratricopeptide (TPR) repeat protein